MRILILMLVLFFGPAPPTWAGDLPPAMQAKFLSIILRDSKADGVACSDSVVAAELQKLGVKINPSSPLVWAKDGDEAKKNSGKLIVCPDVSLLSVGGCVAIVLGGDGRPELHMSATNCQKLNGVVLNDTIVKIAKKH